MVTNPYESPSGVGAPQVARPTEQLVARPVGVSILAVLHGLGGVLLCAIPFLLIANLSSIDAPSRSIGIAPALLIGGAVLLAIVALGSAVGMWTGAKWGWWLGAFYYVYSVFRNGTALVTFVLLADQLEGEARGVEYYILKHGVRIVIHFLLFLYFFKTNVLQFFGLEELSKLKAIGILVGICLAITAVASAVSFFSTNLSQT